MGEEAREVGRVVEAELGRDRRDREICVGEQAAGFEGESGLDGLLGRLASERLGGSSQCSGGVAERLRVVADMVRCGEVAFEQLAKVRVEVVAVFLGGVRRVAAESQDEDGQEVPQRLGLGGDGSGLAISCRVRILAA